MYRAYGVTDRALNMSSQSFCHLDGKFHVPDIIDRVKNPEYVNAVFIGFGDELFNHIVRIVPVPYEILAA